MAVRLHQFVEPPHECGYLPDRRASLEVQVLLEVTASELEAMLERGWRRFGPCYFRPGCRACQECVSLRIQAAGFAPSRTQRRTLRHRDRFRRVVSRPSLDETRLALYARWHADRERQRGWPPNPIDPERYALEFTFPHPAAREAAFFDDRAGGRLVGVGLFDETPHALSAAFFFYDPAYAEHSLGVLNVLTLINDAQRRGLAHLYLGYRVTGCASLEYKANYRPHEVLVASVDKGVNPVWRVNV